jgi:PTH2 family peptidyl-tRNA hydrolase
VLVVRCDLDMGVGKIGAQCGHASVGAYKRLMRTQHKPLVTMWERGGAAKIVVRCKDQRELMELEDAAGLQRLPTFKVSDAGHTQVAAGSVTVLAIGPGPVDAIDAVTGRLKLL